MSKGGRIRGRIRSPSNKLRRLFRMLKNSNCLKGCFLGQRWFYLSRYSVTELINLIQLIELLYPMYTGCLFEAKQAGGKWRFLLQSMYRLTGTHI